MSSWDLAPTPHDSRAGRPFELSSARLLLRALQSSDAETYGALYTDRMTMRFIGPPLTRRQAARSFAAALRSSDPPHGGPLFIAIRDRTSQQALGLCALQQIVRRRAEAGVMVLAGARGRGVATESLRAVIEWGLHTLPLDHIWVRCSPYNRGAERLVHTIGLIRQPPLPDAESSDVIWGIDRTSWHLTQEKNDVHSARVS